VSLRRRTSLPRSGRGNHYEIDLSDDNVDALREAYSDYVGAIRKVSGRQNRTSGGTTAKRGASDELAKIREWANSNGHEVSSRGRISQAVRDAYDAADWHNSSKYYAGRPPARAASLRRVGR